MSFRSKDYWLSAYEKRKIYNEVKAKDIESMTSNRKFKRKLRSMVKDGSIKEYGIKKPGKFISKAYNSGGVFKAAYSRARSETKFYYDARYADY